MVGTTCVRLREILYFLKRTTFNFTPCRQGISDIVNQKSTFKNMYLQFG